MLFNAMAYNKKAEYYDLVVVGTGFASSFFLYSYLKKARSDKKILVLERGRYDSHDWQLSNKSSSSLPFDSLFINRNRDKGWYFAPGFGGGSKIWWGCTPRMMPNDFRLKSKYGVGKDWPVSYDDLEEYYCLAEDIMAVSGPDNSVIYPRSRAYPQPPHLLSDPDKVLQRAYPDRYFPQPCARARLPVRGLDACCVAGICDICPVDAKFTILNGMKVLYDDPRITLAMESEVKNLKINGDSATSAEFVNNGKREEARGDLFVLGAGSLFNPFILLKSGVEHPLLGRNLNEQVSIYVVVELDGIDNLQGSTSITGQGLMLYDGEHRSEYAACMFESYNVAHLNGLRMEKGKWRQRMRFKFIFEDIPDSASYVRISENDPERPETFYGGYSDYTRRSIDRLPEILPGIFSPLPVEKIIIADKVNYTDGHIMGTAVMGDDPENSVVDKHLKHHKIRNLLVLGSDGFPTCPPANPALTISALSLWAADHL
jgi:choline dehydrogenase-like flavoprotein